MVVEGEAVGVLVEVDGGEDDVGHGDGGLVEEGEDRDGIAVGVMVGLIVGY